MVELHLRSGQWSEVAVQQRIGSDAFADGVCRDDCARYTCVDRKPLVIGKIHGRDQMPFQMRTRLYRIAVVDLYAQRYPGLDGGHLRMSYWGCADDKRAQDYDAPIGRLIVVLFEQVDQMALGHIYPQNS